MTVWPRTLLQEYFLFRRSQDNTTIRSERTSVEQATTDGPVSDTAEVWCEQPPTPVDPRPALQPGVQ